MNKKELAQAMAEKADMSVADATKALDAFTDAVTDALKAKDDVKLLGFGTFSVSERAATMGRNVRTGEPIQIKASNQAKFKVGKGLKDALNPS